MTVPDSDSPNKTLRAASEGDKLTLECSDRRERDVTVTGRIQKESGAVTLNAEGHGTTYQIDISPPTMDDDTARLRYPSGSTWVIVVGVESDGNDESLWSDTTAADVLDEVR